MPSAKKFALAILILTIVFVIITVSIHYAKPDESYDVISMIQKKVNPPKPDETKIPGTVQPVKVA